MKGTGKIIMATVIYYHGNTWCKPGDFVQICGSGLSEINSVRLSRLDNKGKYGFILDSQYNRLPTDTEKKTASTPVEGDKIYFPEILQKTDASFKFRLPCDIGEGVYSLSISDKTVYINVPRIEEIMGDEGGIATKGGTIRVIGSNLAPYGKAEAALIADGKYIPLEITKVYDNYSIEVRVPDNMPNGNYLISVSNTFGGATAWSMPFEVAIGEAPRSLWPQDIFNVTDYGAVGTHRTLCNDAFDKTLEAIKENGGGIMYIPKGSYYLTKTFCIPPKTVIRGDGLTNTLIFWTSVQWELDELPETMFTAETEFEVSNITIAGTRIGGMFKAGTPEKPAKDIYIHNVRIFTNAVAGPKVAGNMEYEKRCRMEVRGTGHDTKCNIFVINGDNVQITDSEFRVSAASFYFGRKSHVQIKRNKFRANVRHWTPIGHCRSAIIEDNLFDCMTLGISGEGIYFSRNRIQHVIDNNRESFTTDMGRGDYNGTVKIIDDTTFELPYDPVFEDSARIGYGMFIITGKGFGQFRRIAQNHGRIIKTEEPFEVQPDENSIISLAEIRDRFYFVANSVYDGGHFQLFGTQTNTVLDSCTSAQAGGFFGWAKDIYDTYMPNWYVSFVNNRLSDGLYLHMLYDLNIDNSSGQSFLRTMGVDIPDIDFGILMRGNKLNEFCYMRADSIGKQEGCMRDVIIQGNSVDGAYCGLAITGAARGVLTADNKFENCGENMKIDSEADVMIL